MPKRKDTPPRAWQRMLSGRRLDLLDPSPLDIEIEDIAHGLARVARWNGQTIGAHAFSVAQHTLVGRGDRRRSSRRRSAPSAGWRRCCTMRPNMCIGDLISPFKALLGGEYKAVEQRLLAAIHRRFGLPAPLPAALTGKIKAADRIAAYFEAVALAGFGEAEAARDLRPSARRRCRHGSTSRPGRRPGRAAIPQALQGRCAAAADEG